MATVNRYLLPLFKLNRLAALIKTAQPAIFLIAYGSLPAVAQEPSLKPVTVNERNSPQALGLGLGDAPLARTPVSATVIGAQQVQDAGARRLADVLKFDASTTDAYNSGGYWDYATVRGFVLDNKSNYRRDGLPINAETFIALDNKAQIDVLKGTSGLQAGISAPGGLINYVVKRPTQNDLRSVRLEATQRGGVLAHVDLGGRLGADKALGYRLNVAGETIRHAVQNGKGERSLVALALDARLTSDSLLEAEFEYSRRSQPSVAGFSLLSDRLPAPQPGTNLNNQPWTQPVQLQGLTGSLRYEQAINADWRWQAHWGTQQLKSNDRVAFPFGCTDVSGAYLADRYCPDGSYDLYDFRSDNERRRQTAVKLQVNGKFGLGSTRHDLGFGVLQNRVRDRFEGQAYNYVGTGQIGTAQNFAPDPSLTGTNTHRSERSTEFFVHDAIAWNARLSTWLGLRHTQLHKDSVRTDGSAATAYGTRITTPWLATSYETMPGVFAYASYGEGAETDVTPNLARYANAGQALPTLKSRQMEVGIKVQGQTLRYSAALFNIRRPAFADVGSCDTAATCTRQLDGQARHRGLELAAGSQTGAWALDGGLTLINAQRRGSTANPSLNGQRPTNVPDWVLRANAAYQVASVPGLSVSAHLSHEGARSVLPDGSITLPAWTRLDAGLRYDTQLGGYNTSFTLGIDNLLNKRYWRESPYQFSHAYLFTGAPRTWRLALKTSL